VRADCGEDHCRSYCATLGSRAQGNCNQQSGRKVKIIALSVKIAYACNNSFLLRQANQTTL
jgi:hypothetical protein